MLAKNYVSPIKESDSIALAKRWTPLLCALTGARIVEITQLRKEDIRAEGETRYLRISPEAGSVKGGNFRDVPIHHQLIDTGFLTFVEKRNEGALFHSGKTREKALAAARTTAGRVSEWLRKSGIIPSGVKPNHGWRHRFKSIAMDLEMPARVVDAIQGHAPRTAGEGYGDVSIATKKREIEKIPEFNIRNS